jgi:hypothetical protein
MDVLTDVLATCGLEATLLARQSFYEPWAVRFPCERSLGFHVVTRGEAWLRSTRLGAPIRLRKGDIALLSRGFDHEIATAVDVPVRATVTPDDARVAPEPAVDDRAVQLTLVCGVYQFARTPLHPLFRDLPDSFVLRGDDVPAHSPIHAAIALLSAELSTARAGRDVVTRRLVDILFHYLLREWMVRDGAARARRARLDGGFARGGQRAFARGVREALPRADGRDARALPRAGADAARDAAARGSADEARGDCRGGRLRRRVRVLEGVQANGRRVAARVPAAGGGERRRGGAERSVGSRAVTTS